MTRKSTSQNDIELPLLSKHHRSSFEASRDHLLESQTPLNGKKKYLDINVLNRMLFIWITTIVHRGNEKTFQQDQHYDLRDEEDTYCISQKFSAEWRTVQGKKYALLRTQFQAFKPLVLTTQALAALQTMLDFTGPTLVARIIMYMGQKEQTLSEAILLIVIFIISRICIIIVNAQCQLANTLLQNQVIAGTKALVYKKFLKFPLVRNKEYSSGKIMNLMLVDIENIAKIFFNLPQLFQFPFILFLGIYFIYAAIGLAFIGGVISVIVVTVTVSHITKILFKYQHLVMEAKDERMKKTNEVMTGIKYIKMCGIEDKFTETVSQSREKELAVLRMKQIFHSFRIFSGYLTPVLLVIAVFGCYILFEGELTAEKAFVVLATLTVIQKPINWIGQILNDVLLGQVSLGRVQDFMYTEEIDTSIIDSKKDENENVAVKIKNGNFSWTSEEDFTKNPENLILKNLNLQINKGSFVAILGDVGSGKSSLFNCMMGEMLYDKYSPPSIRLNGSVAYVSQKPWIINATVKENILFGTQFDKNQYSEALRTSCLQSDLKILIKKDETEIGEKGVNLSGGQKARVALARAIYANKDIYLLDDPLSAVDAHVGKYIIEECLTGQLREKTRILVTHKIESLRYVDYIYIFKAGSIVAEGSLDEIRKTPFYQEIEQNATKEAKNTEEAEETEEGAVSSKNSKAASEVKEEAQKRKTTQKQSSRHEGSIHEGEDQKEMLNKLMLDEDRKVGAIGFKAWFTYLGYLGESRFWISQTGMLVVWILLKMGADFWLAHWSNAATDEDNTHSNGYYYGIYTAMGVISASSLFSQTLLMFLKGNHMSRKLHTEMFTRIIRAPLNLFFDRVPLGRLINRFASDLDMVDNTQIQMLTAVSHFPLNLLSRFVVCAIAGTLWVFPLALFFLFVGFKIQRYYLNVYREAFRLNRISSSPVTSTFAESLDGLTQIRVSNYQNKFLSKYAHRQNENMKNQILVAGLQGWFNFHINAASLLIIGPTVAFAVLSSRGSSSASGLIGLLLAYLLDLSNTMIMTLQILSNFESQLIAFERCKAFTNVEVESAPYTQLPVANYTGESWPENGQIEIKNYYAKYRPNLPFVIKDLSIRIKPSEKVGVVGRTGSGKSTTLLCLLRIIESKKGQILIDDVDISQLGLDDLRRKITIIPQDPLLYKGTVRSNLDLFNQYSDMEVWNALEKVCMRNKFITAGLEAEIKEGGENLSAGEKQLVCIARAILSKSKIILIDEATSSIDNVTEEVILQSIHDNFKDCTMITIAHRLKTIIGSDKILFMENGRAVEFDSPHTLLNNRNGHFYKLWKEYENAQV